MCHCRVLLTCLPQNYEVLQWSHPVYTVNETAEHLLLLLLYTCQATLRLSSIHCFHTCTCFSRLSSLATHEHQLVGLRHQAVSYNRDTPSEGSQTIGGPISADVEDGCSLCVTEVRGVLRESCCVQGAALTRWTHTTQGAAISCGAR